MIEMFIGQQAKAGIEWKADAGPGPIRMRAILAPGLELNVSYEGIERLAAEAPKYNVFVFGKRLKGRSASLDEAQERAEKFAVTVLRHALKKVSS